MDPPSSTISRGSNSSSATQPAFNIGPNTLSKPFVQVDDLKAHLSLLRAFKNLRNKVEVGDVTGWSEIPAICDMHPYFRWKWFIEFAVER